MENLPGDIITNISSRLPADSVLCVKMVCRNWNRSIKIDTWFTNIHLCRFLHNCDYYVTNDDIYSPCMKKQRRNDGTGSTHVARRDLTLSISTMIESFLFLAKSYGISPKKTIYYGECFYDEDRVVFKKFTGGYNFNHPTFYQSKKYTAPLPMKTTHTLVGSCNGLVCFAVSDSSRLVGGDPIYICNPVTREEWNLPRYNFIDSIYNYEAVIVTSGFCYVPSTNQYKVVRVCYHLNEYIGDLQVFTLGVDKTWRHKEIIPYFLLNFFKITNATPGVIADGAIHWMDYLEWKIVAFNFEDEVVLEVPTPRCCFDFQESDDGTGSPGLLELKVLRDCLCLVHRRPGRSVDIWSLKKMNMCSCETSNGMISKKCKKDCRDWRWIKEFSIAIEIKEIEYIPVPFAITKTGRILLWYYRSGLSIYDPKTETLSKIPDGDIGTFVYQVIPHVNTFVSLKV
ncbi:F-box protein At3g07870-like [Papaver somniferum]|uniref:F-box protein At3g07870-like n=1 Tax=Papaver somniferum TaxID=3469 RepID=UPI000E702C1A|nr:F-box protein At3g07870-like [Papaver somniferum]